MKRASSGNEQSDGDDGVFPYRASLAAYNVAIPVGWWGAAPDFVAPYEIAHQIAPNIETERRRSVAS